MLLCNDCSSDMNPKIEIREHIWLQTWFNVHADSVEFEYLPDAYCVLGGDADLQRYSYIVHYIAN